MKTRDERMGEWVSEEFRKTGSAAEHYPVFAELFAAVFNGEKVDALDCPTQLVDEDEPEFGTVRQFIEEESPKLFRQYLRCIQGGHSREFARIFALKLHDHGGDDTERASHDAFDAIRAGSWECAMSNPAYAEARAVCLHQGRSAAFADKCAEYLIEGDLDFLRAQKKTAAYEKTFNSCIAKGYPEVRAKAFAEYMVRPDVSGDLSFAEAFARVYEEQVAAQASHIEAWAFADTFVSYYQQFCGDWEESEAMGDNDRARIHALGDLRARGKGFERFDYAEAFASHYGTGPKRDDQPVAEWLAEVETRTDISMKERVLRRANRDGRGCDHRTVYLDLETRRTATEAGGWDKLEQLGVSIAVAITSDGPRVFTEDKIDKLAGLLAHAERIVGYNLRNFDLKVLSGYAGFTTGNARIVDLMDEVERAAGHRVSLQSLASATLGVDLLLNSLDMVKCWRQGRMLELIDGCSNDAFAIQALHIHALKHGELFYFPQGSQQRERLPVGSF